jgi:hypothetical protein
MMPEIETEFLFTIALDVEVLNLGDTPYGSRRVGRFGTGSFEGPILKGTVLLGGACWMLLRHDDALEIEARITLETYDKQHIYMSWKGFRHGPKDVIDRLNRGDAVDPATYYFRTTPFFETSSKRYSWMNRICSIATGTRAAPGRTFQVFPGAIGDARPRAHDCGIAARGMSQGLTVNSNVRPYLTDSERHGDADPYRRQAANERGEPHDFARFIED